MISGRGHPRPESAHHAVPRYLRRIAAEERDLVVPSLVDKLGLIGTRTELLDRIAAMARAGIDEIVIQPVADPETEMRDLADLMS